MPCDKAHFLPPSESLTRLITSLCMFLFLFFKFANQNIYLFFSSEEGTIKHIRCLQAVG